ncbi:hypothetical protein LTR50_006657 [Elasticomyces elasticus]|nr:hypothetical protein LTR50_006657 [Elasticomyces elasticus]
MDGIMEIGDHYVRDVNGAFIGLKGSSEPFSYRELKVCPTCRGPLRNIPRYGRIVRRALLDESTKKFITWSNLEYVPLVENLIEEQERLAQLYHSPPLASEHRDLTIEGSPDHQIKTISSRTPLWGRYVETVRLRERIKLYLSRVSKEEQPFQRVRNMVETHRRRRGTGKSFEFDDSIIQTRSFVRANALLIRCDLLILFDFVEQRLNARYRPMRGDLILDLSKNREACGALITHANQTKNPKEEAEGHVFYAQFAALELLGAVIKVQYDSPLREQGMTHVELADTLCKDHPNQLQTVSAEVDQVRKMLYNVAFYAPVSSDEMRAVIDAMKTEFSGTGHWYRCINGHPFTIGECGMPMQLARCPQCNAPIGGIQHEAVEGVTHASDLEEEFDALSI